MGGGELPAESMGGEVTGALGVSVTESDVAVAVSAAGAGKSGAVVVGVAVDVGSALVVTVATVGFETVGRGGLTAPLPMSRGMSELLSVGDVCTITQSNATSLEAGLESPTPNPPFGNFLVTKSGASVDARAVTKILEVVATAALEINTSELPAIRTPRPLI